MEKKSGKIGNLPTVTTSLNQATQKRNIPVAVGRCRSFDTLSQNIYIHFPKSFSIHYEQGSAFKSCYSAKHFF